MGQGQLGTLADPSERVPREHGIEYSASGVHVDRRLTIAACLGHPPHPHVRPCADNFMMEHVLEEVVMKFDNVLCKDRGKNWKLLVNSPKIRNINREL